RAGLDGGPEARGERVLEAEGGAAALAIGEDVGHQEGRRRLERLPWRSRAIVGPEPERCPAAAVGQGTVRACDLPQAHIRASERERGSVVVRRAVDPREPEAAELGDEGVAADQTEGADGGRVERRRQGGADGDETQEPVLVVVRAVEAARQRDLE